MSNIPSRVKQLEVFLSQQMPEGPSLRRYGRWKQRN